MDQVMRNAAEQGNIDALYSSIARDPKVLDKIDEIPFVETPLHVAAAVGQTQFAMEIIMLKPSFAKKLTPNGLTPLVLAMCNDQTMLVRELLVVHKDLVLAQGRGGMNPLHYAAQMGNLYLLTEFLRVCPKLIEEVTGRSETALHIALKNDEFDAFLVLVGWLRRVWFKNAALWQRKLLNWMDVDGNTLLHIASSKNEAQVVRRLLDCKVQVKIKNSAGQTPLEIVVENTQGASREIKEMLLRAKPSSDRDFSVARYLMSPIPISERLFIWFLRQKMQISIDKGNMLLVVAVLLVTVTYQGVLSPPGGFWQDDFAPANNRNTNSTFGFRGGNEVREGPHVAGTVTMEDIFFQLLLPLNSLTLYITLLLIVLVIPPDLTSVLLFASLMSLFLSYGVSAAVITPSPAYSYSCFSFFISFVVLNVVLHLVVTCKHKLVFLTFVEVEESASPTFVSGWRK